MKLLAILLLLITVVGVGLSGVRAQPPAAENTAQVPAKDPAVAPFDGGSPNKIAQLGVCKELEVVPFSELKEINKTAFTLMENTHGKKAERAYQKASVYDNAVLLNTAAAAADLGADLSSASILKPYYSDKSGVNTGFERLPFGYYFKGFSGIRIPPVGKKSKSDRYGIRGSVEVSTDENGDTHFDVDLYNPKSIFYAEHLEEVLFNEAYRRPTHPGDVAKLLFDDRKLKTGVSCKS
jgi:hypothetical protein